MMVSPPPDIGSTPATAPPRPVSSPPEHAAPLPGGAAAALDRAYIKPLDIPAALQILLAEVREAFEPLLIDAGAVSDAEAGNAPPASIDGPVPAARALVQFVLQSLPDSLGEHAWAESLPRTEAALQSGVQRAVDAVSAWRDVSPVVVETTRESVRLAMNVLGDESQNPLWLRPEWLAMAPRLTRFRRRRRALARRLTDPDHGTAGTWNETDDYPR